MSSAQSPAGAEISWHDGQYPSLQPVLGHQHSFLLNTRKTVFQTSASCHKSYNRISHPSRILSFYGQNFLCLLRIEIIQMQPRHTHMTPLLMWWPDPFLCGDRSIIFLESCLNTDIYKRERIFLCCYTDHQPLNVAGCLLVPLDMIC